MPDDEDLSLTRLSIDFEIRNVDLSVYNALSLHLLENFMGDISNHSQKLSQINTMISIGGICRTRFQIENFISKLPNFNNYWTGTHYFDYLMSGGIAGVANVISRGFEIHRSSIEIANYNNKFIPRDITSKHVFKHDFGLSWWNSDYENAVLELKENMDHSIAKYQYLGKKTNDLLKSDLSVALVYYGQEPEDQWIKLKKILFSCYGKNIPVINILEMHQKAPVIEGIYISFVDDENSPKKGLANEWEGWDESWLSAFNNLGLFR